MFKKLLKKLFGSKDEDGVMIEVDDPYHGLRVNDYDCCSLCTSWICSNPLAWGWGIKQDPDGIGSCDIQPEKWLKYGGDWCSSFTTREEIGSDG